MKKILIPIDASKELPLIEKWYFVKDKNGDEEIGYFADNYFTVWGWNKKDVIAWYKEVTIDELLPKNKEIKKYINTNKATIETVISGIADASFWSGAQYTIDYIKQKIEG